MATHSPPRLTRGQRAELLQGVYVIFNEGSRFFECARAVLDAGVRIVQYRAKSGIVGENVRALRELTRQHDALLILNDDWRAAVALDCDGVHLGPDDDGFERVAPVRDAIPERLIGLSCGTLAEVGAANAADVDYLGVGSVFATTSKHDAGVPIGVASLRGLVHESDVPVAAVGGITAATIAEVRHSGAAMAAVISAISTATNPYESARELIDAWNR